VKILILSVLVVAMIGLMVPSASAAFPDPDKDPRDYLIRYYTEPDYKDWFDSQFPNTTIEKKVGYPNKIVTDDYYVDPVFEFALLNPSTTYFIDPIAQSVKEDMQGLFSVFFGGNDDWYAGYIIWYFQSLDDDIPPRELTPDEIDVSLDLWSFLPYDAITDEEGMSVQLKITDQTYNYEFDRHELRYDYNTSTYYSESYWDENVIGQKFIDKRSIVLLLYPNGDIYEIIFDSPAETFSEDVKEFDKIVKSFYVGKTEKFSDMYEDYLGVQKSESVPEPTYAPEPVAAPESDMCGEGTTYKNGQCVPDNRGGGCLIATAAFGSEMAPQVQFLREIRDNTVMSTESGTAFMTGFNQFYYSFSPQIADYERENPVFKEAVKVTLTPLLTSLTLLNYVEIDSEEEMLGYGIGTILLNVGMYFVAPAVLVIALKNRLKN